VRVKKDCGEFIVTREVVIERAYTVEANSLQNAIAQIEENDYSAVIDRTDSDDIHLGNIIRAEANKYEQD
tara:strand:+ start:166 stop:375 length:210 start_codon:yes stop_codon:yes gene_type:complete